MADSVATGVAVDSKVDGVKGEFCGWMEALDAECGLGKLSLLKTVLPGTHDSATCNISLTKNYASNAPGILTQVSKVYSGEALKRLVCDWAIAQERSILEQLEDGIRYLDLRVCLVQEEGSEEVGDMFTCHSVISDNIKHVLEQVKQFNDANPKEILVLDFNHFYEMTPKAHVHLASHVKELFGSKLIPNTVSIADTTIEEYWKAGQSILAFYMTPELEEIIPDHGHLFSQKLIHSAWMNTPNIKVLKKKLEAHLELRQNVLATGEKAEDELDYCNILHVTQGILTPNASMIASSTIGFGCESLTAVGQKTTPKVAKWTFERWHTKDLNVIIADHYHFADFVSNIVSINRNKLAALK